MITGEISIIVTSMESEWNKINEDIPYDRHRNCGGIYFIYNYNKELMYIGKAKNINQRISQHKRSHQSEDIRHHFYYYSYFICSDPVNRDIYETFVINKYKPKLNRSKTYTYESEYMALRRPSAYEIEQEKIAHENLVGFKI